MAADAAKSSFTPPPKARRTSEAFADLLSVVFQRLLKNATRFKDMQPWEGVGALRRDVPWFSQQVTPKKGKQLRERWLRDVQTAHMDLHGDAAVPYAVLSLSVMRLI